MIHFYNGKALPLEELAFLLKDISSHSPWLQYQSIENLPQSLHCTQVQVTAGHIKPQIIYNERTTFPSYNMVNNQYDMLHTLYHKHKHRKQLLFMHQVEDQCH